jgi:Flp pilus assembly protein TadD
MISMDREALLGDTSKNLRLVCMVLAAVTVAVFMRAATFGFVTLDDADYVYGNPHVKQGLTPGGIVWAFKNFDLPIWHPLTWISHMADTTLFGVNAPAAHMVNILLHAGSAIFLFLALNRMTGKLWRCALVAALFSLHPLRVESVVWIAERKDVLSAFFSMLTLFFYARYAESPGPRRYAAVASTFALALLAKPMPVTLPLVLLLLDFWPLRRLPLSSPKWPELRRPVLEKLPLLGISALFSAMAIVAQLQYSSGMGLISLETMPLASRLENIPVVYLAYLGKLFWPIGLSVMYPYQAPAAAVVAVSTLVMCALTVMALLAAPRRPWLTVGWLWYLGMLFPVCGLMQNGTQSIADRYTYLPSIGLLLALVWGLADLAESRVKLRRPAAAAACAALMLFSALTWRQEGYWQDSETLYRRALAVSTPSYLVLYNLAKVLEKKGNYKESIDDFEAAIALYPGYAPAYDDLAKAWGALGRWDKAVVEANKALEITKGADPEAEDDLCIAYNQLRKPSEALKHCRASIMLNPAGLSARFDLSLTLMLMGRRADAAAELSRLLQDDPDYPGAQDALKQLGVKP